MCVFSHAPHTPVLRSARCFVKLEITMTPFLQFISYIYFFILSLSHLSLIFIMFIYFYLMVLASVLLLHAV